MLSFHNDPAIKEKYIARLIHHREMDNIIQGTGWENGKGCAVGCTLENYDHSRYPEELGLPEWMAHLKDRIFEGLPNAQAKEWPIRFLQAIPIGKSLEDIKHLIAIKRLKNLIKLQQQLKIKNPNLDEIFTQVISAIEVVTQCHEAELNHTSCDWSAVAAAESAVAAARAATWSAESWSEESVAAWSAVAAAESASWSAAESASWSAAWAAQSAAWAARSESAAAWIKEADDLIEVLESL